MIVKCGQLYKLKYILTLKLLTKLHQSEHFFGLVMGRELDVQLFKIMELCYCRNCLVPY